MKGIVLAGGRGTRLDPITRGVSKQLMPIYDKPMIYYPISMLMLAGIREILIITMVDDQEQFKKLLGDGSQFGVSFEYAVQEEPNGLSEAFLIGEGFLAGEGCCLVLGDNLFYGDGLVQKLRDAVARPSGATVFGYHVQRPQDYGVIEFDEELKAISVEEKPKHPKSHFAVTGIYFFDPEITALAKKVKPSGRGELEITCAINEYLQAGNLQVQLLSRGAAWFDTGTHDSMLDAVNFVAAIEKRTGQKIACLEEIAYLSGWLSKAEIQDAAEIHANSPYGDYLRSISDIED